VRFLKPNGLNQKKGISSIVGGIFFLVLMTSGFTVYYVALDSQSQMLDTQQVIADNEVAKIREKFVVAATSSGVNNVLSVQVINTGNNLVEIADVWIVNKTSVFKNATKYNDLDYRDVFIPVGYNGNILENHAPLNLISDIYDIKVISSFGTIQTVEYDVAGGSNVLNAQMVAIPQDVRYGENVTIALIVTNVGEFDITQVTATPKFEVSPNQCLNPPNLIFGGPANLSPSQSTMFFWDCVLTQPIGNTITFIGNATGKILGVDVDSNDASDSVIVRDFAAAGEGDEIILKDELFGRPKLFLIFPNPMGDENDDLALWGVNIANPTDQIISVSKVVILGMSAKSTSSDKTFIPECEDKIGTNLKPVTVPPTSDRWTCPEGNQLQWKDLTNPQPIQPRSVFPFLVRIGPDTIGTTTTEAENIVIQTTVFTTLGQFGKSGYVTTFHQKNAAMPNVYLSRDKASVDPNDIQGEIRSIVAGNIVTFNATIADMSVDSTYGIVAGSRLIINIPKEWNSPTLVDSTGFDVTTLTQFPDGSAQIVGNLTSALNTGAKTIQFTAIAPIIFKAKMYTMHILADGSATGETTPPEGLAIGPIAEIVLQVCPITGGPQPECPP